MRIPEEHIKKIMEENRLQGMSHEEVGHLLSINYPSIQGTMERLSRRVFGADIDDVSDVEWMVVHKNAVNLYMRVNTLDGKFLAAH